MFLRDNSLFVDGGKYFLFFLKLFLFICCLVLDEGFIVCFELVGRFSMRGISIFFCWRRNAFYNFLNLFYLFFQRKVA